MHAHSRVEEYISAPDLTSRKLELAKPSSKQATGKHLIVRTEQLERKPVSKHSELVPRLCRWSFASSNGMAH